MEMEILDLCDDDQMACLRATFLKTGKGRRASLPTIVATNKLFLQLYQLRCEGKVTIAEVEKWYLKLFPESAYPSEPNRLWKRIQRILKAANSKSEDDLRQFLHERLDLNFISDSLQSVGVTRALKEEQFIKCFLTNGIVSDLGNFLIPEGYSYKYFLDILKKLSFVDLSVSAENLRQKFLLAEKSRSKLVKAKSRKPEALTHWLSEFFFHGHKDVDKAALGQRPEEVPVSALVEAALVVPPPLSSASDWPPLSMPHPIDSSSSSTTELTTSLGILSVISQAHSPTTNLATTASSQAASPQSSSSQAAPSHSSSAQAASPQSSSSQAAPSHSSSAQAASPQSSSSQAAPSHSSSAQAASSQSLSAQAVSSQFSSAQAVSSQFSSAQASSSQSLSSQAAPSQSSSAQAAPSQSSSAQAVPSQSSSSQTSSAQAAKKSTSSRATPRKGSISTSAPSSDLNLNALFVDLEKMKQENCTLKKKAFEMSKEMKALKKSKVYKTNFLLKKKCSDQAGVIQNLKLQNNDLKNQMSQLKQDKLSLQKNLSKYKKKCEVLKESSDDLLYTLNHIHNLDEIEKQVNLKDSKFNKFSDSVRLTYMSLQGEANVSATNCSKVVQIVANNLFNHSLSMKDLPCASTALRIMNEGNHVAKYQVIDEVNKTDNFTYASDGTSRQKMHFMERHLVLDNCKSISMGFSHIASDDANSMLEQTIRIFSYFVNIYGRDMGDEEKGRVLKDIVSKMNCVMSDRASNMKLLNKKIHEWRKDLLDDNDVTTHFLYCNAHFLLGLCTAAEKGISEIEQEIVNSSGVRLGRDGDEKFKHFWSSKESAALRCIRTAAEVLGPRGDEKSGARQEWLSYCDQINVTSKFSSFRSNRFNNVFDNASALVYHREHVLDFLINKASGENLKLQSVVADLQDVKVISIVASLSLFNFTITGPYWRLMNSSLPYGSFPIFVKKLKAVFEHFLSLSSFEDHHMTPVFEDFSISDVTTNIFVKEKCSVDIVMSAFKCIVKESKIILERQLSDF